MDASDVIADEALAEEVCNIVFVLLLGRFYFNALSWPQCRLLTVEYKAVGKMRLVRLRLVRLAYR